MHAAEAETASRLTMQKDSTKKQFQDVEILHLMHSTVADILTSQSLGVYP